MTDDRTVLWPRRPALGRMQRESSGPFLGEQKRKDQGRRRGPAIWVFLMKRKADAWNIVLAGFWNRMIFAPEWVSPRLFPEPHIETLVALLPVMPLIYQDPEVAMEISGSRLIFRPRQPAKDKVLLRAEEMARKVLKDLPETPVQAVGVNFGFREDYPPAHLLSMFNASDDDDLAQGGWKLEDRKIVRRLQREGETLNLTLTLTGSAVELDCNFHTDIAVRANAPQTVESGRVVRLRDTALQLITQTYRLKLDEEVKDG